MRFQVTEKITTDATITQVGEVLQDNFRRIAASVIPVGSILRVTSIQATFGSVNRTDVTDITIKPTDDGYLLIANVEYRPSVAFWIIFLISLLTWVLWIIPVAFYLLQKDTVKNCIQEGFRNVKNELPSSNRAGSSHSRGSTLGTAISDLEKLGSLLSKELISQEEFDHQKKVLLGMANAGSLPTSRHTPPVLKPTPSSSSKSTVINDEDKASSAFESARECLSRGEKDMAIEILKDIVKRFPNTKAGSKAQKSLAARK